MQIAASYLGLLFIILQNFQYLVKRGWELETLNVLDDEVP